MGFFTKHVVSRWFNAGFAIQDEFPGVTAEADYNDQDNVMLIQGESTRIEDDAPNRAAVTENTGSPATNAAVAISEVGISDIVRLMHSLPGQGNSTELTAVLKTFKMFGVQLDSLVVEANRKEQLTRTRLDTLHREIENLQGGITQRQQEVAVLQLGHQEILKLNQTLQTLMSLEQDDTEATKLVSELKPSVSDWDATLNHSPLADITAFGDNETADSTSAISRRLNSRAIIDPGTEDDYIDLDLPPKQYSSIDAVAKRRQRRKATAKV